MKIFSKNRLTFIFIFLYWLIFFVFNTIYFHSDLLHKISPTMFIVLTSINAAVTFTSVLFFLQWHHKDFVNLGLVSDHLPLRLLVGFACAVIAATLYNYVLLPAAEYLLPASLTILYSPEKIISDTQFRPFFFAVFVLAIPFTEELMRAFVLDWFGERWHKKGIIAGLILHSFFFGYSYVIAGVPIAVCYIIIGLFLGMVYLRRHSLLESLLMRFCLNFALFMSLIKAPF